MIPSRLSNLGCTSGCESRHPKREGRRLALVLAHLYVDPTRLCMLGFRNAEAEHAMFEFGGHLTGIELLRQREDSPEPRHADLGISRLHAFRHRDAHLALYRQSAGLNLQFELFLGHAGEIGA